MAERLPLLIGITGKRQFSDKLYSEKELAGIVRQRIAKIFQVLDNDYPEVPKILLTGGAYGADLIAARAALERNDRHKPKRWAVVALLPFERDEFRKDFERRPEDPQGAEWTNRYQQYVSDFEWLMAIADKAKENKEASPRVVVHELPKLLAGPPVPGQPKPRDATVNDLLRRPGQPNTLRDDHYEQVGQFIAESANVLIAVMAKGADASANATGGTARIVAYRRIGRPDEVGADVARRSRILRQDWSDLAAPPAGFVWLVDPFPPKPDAERPLREYWKIGRYPVEILPPLRNWFVFDKYPQQPACRMSAEQREQSGPLRRWWETTRAWLERNGIVRAQHEVAHHRLAEASLTSAKALKIFNRHKPTAPQVVANVADIPNLTQESKAVADLISGTQMRQNKRSRGSFWCLAGLFVVAIFVLEIYAKFLSKHSVPLALYLLLLGLIASIVFLARRFLWQAKAEDYRAVAEMLRVQDAWWSAGVPLRVDREHLQGADRELARIRDAAASAIAWMLIRYGLKVPPVDWSSVRGNCVAPRKGHNKAWDDWIGGQLAYFSVKKTERLDSVRRSDALSWTLFMASGFMAVILAAWVANFQYPQRIYPFYRCFERVAGFFGAGSQSHWPVGVLVWPVIAWLALRFRVANHDLKRWQGLAATWLLGLVIAFCLACAAISAAWLVLLLDPKVADEALTVAKSIMVIGLVGLSALAGARRYLTERLNIEAEAHDYRDAGQRFEHAEHALARKLKDAVPTDPEAAQKIVIELGRLALAENEAWLKSRRERPLTPVVG